MFISFNDSSGFRKLENESKEEALYRILSYQLINCENHDSKIPVDWDKMDRYIGDTPFVLLIDEINSLCYPIDNDVKRVLNKYFLDKRNRYLVMTTHIPVNLDGDGIYSFMKPVLSVSLPLSIDLTLLKSMGNKCNVINNQLVAYYGGIPSLLYCEYQNKDSSPRNRFNKYTWKKDRGQDEYINFVDELIHGNIPHECNRVYHKLASLTDNGNNLKWPPCYIHCILSLFISTCEGLKDMLKCLSAIEVCHEGLNEGIWWEQTVILSLLLHLVLSTYRGNEGPFGICGIGEAIGASIHVIKIDIESNNPNEMFSFMSDQITRLIQRTIANKKHFIIFVPTCSTFKQFDGFLIFVADKTLKIIGYQCKLGSKGADGEIPQWMNKAVLITGKSFPRTNNNRGWNYLNDDDIISFLGCSLSVLYPKSIN